MELVDVLAGLALAVGLVGILVPLLPGTLLVALTLLVWALAVGGAAWAYAAAALVLLALTQVVKYALPGRHLKTQGVPRRSLLAGAVLGVVGFFVVPVVGLVVGFVLGVYLAELQRLGHPQAWPSTKAAMKAVGLALLLELGGALLASTVWLVGAAST